MCDLVLAATGSDPAPPFAIAAALLLLGVAALLLHRRRARRTGFLVLAVLGALALPLVAAPTPAQAADCPPASSTGATGPATTTGGGSTGGAPGGNTGSVPAPTALLTVASPTVTLDSTGSGDFIITNASASVLATNVGLSFATATPGLVVASSTCQLLAPGQSCRIRIDTANAAPGTVAATIQGDDTNILAVSVIVSDPRTTLVSDRSSLTFSHAGSETITIVNTGSIAATNVIATLAGESTLSANSTCGFILAPQAACTVFITYAPPANYVASPATLTVRADNADDVVVHIGFIG